MPTYLAELSAADYPRFRQRDPSLPATHAEWMQGHQARITALRGRRADVVSYPIHFDSFVERNHHLGIPDFDRETRDDYADEVARAHGLSFWM